MVHCKLYTRAKVFLSCFSCAAICLARLFGDRVGGRLWSAQARHPLCDHCVANSPYSTWTHFVFSKPTSIELTEYYTDTCVQNKIKVDSCEQHPIMITSQSSVHAAAAGFLDGLMRKKTWKQFNLCQHTTRYRCAL